MSLANWYNNQYAAWNRTRRLRVAPTLAREDTRTSTVATAMNRTRSNIDTPGAVVIDMGDVTNGDGTPTAGAAGAATGNDASKKKQATLFGPNIGVVSTGPAWADLDEKSAIVDELTQDVVEGWVTKSKDPSQPTTTLQALVNLKRPTIRLSPLDVSSEDDPEDASHHDHHHGLEFEFDCDAPKCGIRVHVFLPSNAKDADKNGMQRVDVFDQVVDGGFGRVLKLEDGAMLELGKFERQAAGGGANGTEGPAAGASSVDSPDSGQQANGETGPRHRKRFTLAFRRRHAPSSTPERPVTGPALAVVDAVGQPNAQSTTTTANNKDAKDEKEEEGVRVAIRLAALDKEGQELSSPNVQSTYLQVVRFGNSTPAVEGEGDSEEDTRPWVVKVVKREATIGPHTFSLHEIYGLASHASAPTAPLAPTAPPPADEHTYPPNSPTTTTAAATAAIPGADDTTSECILCLSSPREVVLLPCRHLVACRDCAVNMVEFGAGGALVHNTDDAPAAGADGVAEPNPSNPEGNAEAGLGNANGEGASQTETPAAPVPTTTGAGRRKRKAKGWFCPICRQPYTSLLRITTTPPEKEIDDEARASMSVADEDDHQHAPAPANALVAPPAAAAAAPVVAQQPSQERSGGMLGGVTRPGFLRGFSRGSMKNETAQASPPVSVPSTPSAVALASIVPPTAATSAAVEEPSVEVAEPVVAAPEPAEPAATTEEPTTTSVDEAEAEAEAKTDAKTGSVEVTPAAPPTEEEGITTAASSSD